MSYPVGCQWEKMTASAIQQCVGENAYVETEKQTDQKPK